MDVEILKKLATNPHYRLNEKQRKLLESLEEENEVEPMIHDNYVEPHEVEIIRHERLKKESHEKPKRKYTRRKTNRNPLSVQIDE